MDVQTLVTDLAIRYGFQVLGALLILAAGVLAARWIGAMVDRRLRKTNMEPPMRILMIRVLRVLVFAVAVVMALDKFGFQIAPLIAGIGVAGVGVGFALQGVLSNVFAGLTIIVTKPFRVGEYIAVAGVQGEVINIDLPSTVLTHADRSRVVVPNRKIVGEILHNYGTIKQIKVTVSVSDPEDINATLTLIHELLAQDARALKDPAPVVGVSAVGDEGVRIAVMPWARVPDGPALEADLYKALIETLHARGIGLGVPRREIRMVNGAAVTRAGSN
jgi:small conductance mechanosensitive channel